jgi:predicted ATPase/DNA-binding XRE family transcriptional regulator
MNSVVTEMPPFGALLRRLRMTAGLSRDELAERAGLSAKAVEALERGARASPRPTTVRLLADALNVEPSVRVTLSRAAGHAAESIAPGQHDTPRLQLPIPPTPIVGRGPDLARASQLLDPHAATARLVTLLGPAGVGKTRLALAIAAEVGLSYGDRAVFVDLAPVHDARLVAAAVAQSLGLQEIGGRSARELVLDYLAGRQLLLVLDNFEHLLGAASLVAELLAQCAEIRVLVTSRAALRLRAEHRVTVAPLALAEATHSFEDIAAAPAVQLFVQRAQALLPEFELTESNAADVARICSHLDGLPLAIELAAARVGLLPPGTLLRRFERRLTCLTSGAADLPERQRTLRNALAWSFGLLTPDEQAVFARLSVFVGGCTVEAAEAVCALDGPIDVLESVSSLIDNSMVRLEDGPEPRIRLLETVREYAAEQLNQRHEQLAARSRHAAYFLAWAEAGAGRADGPDGTSWFQMLEQERENLRAALDSLVEQTAAVDALRLAHAVAPFWLQRGPFDDARTRLGALLALPGTDATSVRAAALLDCALMAWAQADYATEQQLAEAAVVAYREAGDPAGSARALADLAAANVNAGIYAVARELARQVLAAQPDKRCRSYWRALMVLGSCARDEGDFESAAQYYQQVVDHTRRAGDGEWMGHALGCLGWMAFFAGDMPAARRWQQEALELRQARGQLREIAVTLTGLGHVALASGDRDQARALYAQSLNCHRDVGNQWGIVLVLEGCAAVAASTAPTLALRLTGAATTLRSLIHRPMPRAEKPIHQRWLESARRALGPIAAAAAYAEGAAMPAHAALADAANLVNPVVCA